MMTALPTTQPQPIDMAALRATEPDAVVPGRRRNGPCKVWRVDPAAVLASIDATTADTVTVPVPARHLRAGDPVTVDGEPCRVHRTVEPTSYPGLVEVPVNSADLVLAGAADVHRVPVTGRAPMARVEDVPTGAGARAQWLARAVVAVAR